MVLDGLTKLPDGLTYRTEARLCLRCQGWFALTDESLLRVRRPVEGQLDNLRSFACDKCQTHERVRRTFHCLIENIPAPLESETRLIL
jgi:hypothetical protein